MIFGYFCVDEIQLARVRGAPTHFLVGSRPRVAGRVLRHNDIADLRLITAALARDRRDRHPAGHCRSGACDKALAAVDETASSTELGGGLCRAGIRTGLRLRQTERPQLFAAR